MSQNVFQIKATEICFQIYKNSKMIVTIIPGGNGGRRLLDVVTSPAKR